jgi:hypothetical protein
MRVDPEKRPAGETGVDAAFQPRHRFVRFSEYSVHAGDLVIDMMRVAEGAWHFERGTHGRTRMNLKTLTPIFVLPLVPVAALTVALSTGTASVSASSDRGRPLHVTKVCPGFEEAHVGAWEFCEITSSNLRRIKDSKVYYVDPPNVDLGLQDSAVVLDAGNGNRAVGRYTVDYGTGLGLCTFSDGTGNLAGFNARVQVSPLDASGLNWRWEGTYSFD